MRGPGIDGLQARRRQRAACFALYNVPRPFAPGVDGIDFLIAHRAAAEVLQTTSGPRFIPVELNALQRHAQHFDANVCVGGDCDSVSTVPDLTRERTDIAEQLMVHGVNVCLDMLLGYGWSG